MPKNYHGGYTPTVCRIEGCKGLFYGRNLCHEHYFRMKRTGDPLTKVDPSRQLRGKAAEASVADILRTYGRSVSPSTHTQSDFDLTVDGHLVDVKCSGAHTDKYGLHWFISFSHHGKLDESGKDFYILRLEEVPHVRGAVHLLFHAPLGKATMRLNMSQLVGEYAGAIARFYIFAGGGYQKEKVA